MPAPKGHQPYNKQGEGGRPPKYNKEDIERFADEFKKWLDDPKHIWFKDFALDNDLDPDWLSEWAVENERFGGIYRQARHRQESRLVNGGLLNAFNGPIVKLVLANAHGWKTEKTESKLSGDAQDPLSVVLNSVAGTTKDMIDDESDSK